MMRILVVEDEKLLCDGIAEDLELEKYTVERCYDGAEAYDLLLSESFDLLILDLNLPGMDGLDLLRAVRAEQPELRVLILSARAELSDRVAGLDLGADDYLTKPFHLDELNARIKSVLRRQRSDGSRSLRLGNLRIEPDSFRVFVDDKELELLKKEYDILFYFANRPNHIIDKAVLAEAVWGDHIDQADSFHFVYAQVKNLRQQLKKAGATIEIRSIYGFGYKLVINEEE